MLVKKKKKKETSILLLPAEWLKRLTLLANPLLWWPKLYTVTAIFPESPQASLGSKSPHSAACSWASVTSNLNPPAAQSPAINASICTKRRKKHPKWDNYKTFGIVNKFQVSAGSKIKFASTLCNSNIWLHSPSFRHRVQVEEKKSHPNGCTPAPPTPSRDSEHWAVEIRSAAAPHLSTEATQYEEKCCGWTWPSVNYSPFKILLSSNSAEEMKGTAEHGNAE